MDWYISVNWADGLRFSSKTPLMPGSQSLEIEDLIIHIDVTSHREYTRVFAEVKSATANEVFLSITSCSSKGKPLWNFDGEVKRKEIFRQSPHDVDAWIVKGIARQSVPLVAIAEEGRFHAALNGSPMLYRNGCSQYFDPEAGIVELRSGDNGATPGIAPSPRDLDDFKMNLASTQKFSPGRIIPVYHPISDSHSHCFETILFTVEGDTLEALREEANRLIAKVWAPYPVEGTFGALAFSTAWMNLRCNDSGKSNYWVVPAAEYSNRQYNRDAYWIALMLDPEMDRECLLSELADIDPQADYPLLTMLWAKRVKSRQGKLDFDQLQACLEVILSKNEGGWYQSFTPEDGRNDFQYWADVVAFESDDSIAYNQGFFAVALMVAEEFGLNAGGVSTLDAAKNYQSLFDEGRGYVSVSRKKVNLFGPDALLPDLIAQIYYGVPLLSRESVMCHINTLNRHALTEYGYKVLARVDRDYPEDKDYDIEGYTSQANKGDFDDGGYIRGGSWFLYDTLCLLDGVLHGVPAAQQLLIWRIRMEMDQYGTTFEYINTRTGEAHKSNMGWNVVLYGFLKELIHQGRISTEILKQIEA